MIDATTGKRWPIWVEIDSNASRPGEGGAARSTRRSTSPPGTATSSRCATSATPPARRSRRPSGFRYYRDNAALRSRTRSTPGATHFEEIFTTLQQGRASTRSDLYLAWDFTVASDQNNAGRELAMRNDAFAQLGDTNLADRIVAGHLADVHGDRASKNEPEPGPRSRGGSRARSRCPATCSPSCAPGRHDAARRQRRPGRRTAVWTANFDCIIPRSATTGAAGAGAARRSTGTACSATPREVALGPAARPRPGPRHRPLRDRRDRDVANPTSRSRSAALQNLSHVPGARRPPPAGPARRAVPRAG